MDQIHREVLRKSLLYLMDNLDREKIATIGDYLLTERLFSVSHLDKLGAQKTTRDQVRQLIVFMLPKTGPRGYQCFTEALSKGGWSFIVDSLNATERALRGSGCLHGEPPSRKHSSSDQTIPHYLEVVVKGKPEMEFEVQKCKPGHVPSKHDVYEMSHSPHGRALIITNQYFVRSKARPGAEVDTINLVNLFRQLKFEPVTKKNLSSEDMIDVLKVEQQRCNSPSYDCDAFIVVIMSHGSREGILGTDDKPVAIDEITDIFDTTSCPGLTRKPKIFIFHACRGADDSAFDISDDSTTTEPSAYPNSGPDLGSSGKTTFTPNTSRVNKKADMFVMNAIVEGFRTWSDPQLGGWFVRTLVYVFATYAYKKQLSELVDNINFFMSQLELPIPCSDGVSRNVQMCGVLEKKTTLKGFHFCPGL